MANLPSVKRYIQIEESRFKFAVSESMIQKMGSSVNFINERVHSEKQFFINGHYGLLSVPYYAIEGLVVFNFDAEIINAIMFIVTAGSSGVTELDIKKIATKGGTPTSIFSTTPKITSAAGNYQWVGVGESGTGLTAPVFTSVNANGNYEVNANQALSFDLIQAQGGTPRSCGILMHYVPR